MTSDDFDTWRVLYSQFVGADFKSGISFVLNNVPDAQDSCKARKKSRSKWDTETAHGRRDLDPGATVYGL